MADADVCIKVEGLSKKFARSLKRSFIYGAQDFVKDLFGLPQGAALRSSEFWALRDISFTLRRGQALGIVGLNGSGKTTLLRTVCGVLRPTTGEVQINGQIAPLLALGAGFKPVLSGRENVFLNMSLLGLSTREILDRFDEVMDFADLRDAIDAPLGTYSSGMKARLGFACAVHTNPSILMVDEVLSVGDARFRAKCRNKINELRKTGTSMILVSHSSISIETLCDECLYLVKGRVAAKGTPTEVLRAYEAETLDSAVESNDRLTASIAANSGSGDVSTLNVGNAVELEEVRLTSGQHNEIDGYWRCGAPGRISFSLRTHASASDLSVNVMVIGTGEAAGETHQLIMSSKDIGWVQPSASSLKVILDLPQVVIRPGTYRLKISISSGEFHDIVSVVDNMKLVIRDPGRLAQFPFYQPRNWVLEGGVATGREETDDDLDAESVESF